MESAVTKLLVATRQLLESLQMWSTMRMSDLEVSDTYVKLGNDFNNAVGAFVQNGVGMDDLLSVPQDLRECLESLLALDPTPQNLDIYLPRVRQIIVTLLSGLKAKQALYRRLQAAAGTPYTGDSISPPSEGELAESAALAKAHAGERRLRAEARAEPQFRNPFSGAPEGGREVRGRPGSGISVNSQGSREQDSGGRGGVHKQQQQQRISHQARPPARPDLPPPAQMITTSTSTTLATPPTTASHPDRHLSTSTTSSLPSRSRIGAPLPPAPPDAFRPPRRRVTPSETGRATPTPPMGYTSVFDPPEAATGRALPAPPTTSTSTPNIPTRSSERERYALTDQASPSPDGSPPKRHSRTIPSQATAVESGAGDPMTPPRRRSHVSKRNSGGSSAPGSAERHAAGGDLAAGGGGQYPGSRFSLDSEATDTPKSRRRMTALTSRTDTGGGGGEGPSGGPPLLPPLSGLPSLEEGLSVDTTSKARLSPSGPAAAPETTTTAAATESPAALASLTALQNSEALGRRASKRFSQYQYKQLLPGHHKGPSSSSMRHSKMDSLVEDESSIGGGPVPGGPSPVRPARRLPSRSQEEVPPVPPIPEEMRAKRDGERDEVEEAQEVKPIPTIVTPDSDLIPAELEDAHQARETTEPTPAAASATSSADTPTPYNIRVFLQYGRETKKVVLDRREVTSIPDLQGLFMNKFEYAPDGMEMFPDVYIKDPVTGIAYHLEDMDDVKPDVLLSLNIDQLDQVKQHFDNTISGLLHEIKELKHNVSQNRRLSAFKPDHSTLSPSMHPADRPSARSPARIPAVTRPSSPVATTVALPDSAAPLVITPNLHAQLNDVQTLRRELGIMRQQYVDFVNQSKTAFQTIRDQTQTMREISTTKLSGSRALLNSGKSALEKDSSEVVRAVEEVSDAIDNVKDDVVRRQILPPPNQMESMRKNLEEAKAHVEKLKQQVSLVAPAWKSTWNEELSTVLEEQRLLKYHESLATDLEGDITQASGIYATLQQYMAQRQQGLGMTRRQFRAPARTPETTVPNLLLEIRTQEADPNRRLRAIEEQQKAREREKAAKADDEFSAELSGFVAGRKLKKTGGTEEAERLRLRKQEQSFKKMYPDKREKQGGDLPSPVTPSTAMSEAGLSSAPDSPAPRLEEFEAEKREAEQST